MLGIVSAMVMATQTVQAIEPFAPQGFRTEIEVTIAAPPETVFDAATGDISGWWDHTFWPGPTELVIEPELDGRFYERFEAGEPDGVVHARVIFVDRPSQLRLDGPLGLSGRAVHLVSSWTLEPANDGEATLFRVDLALTGEIDAELAGVVRSVWVHFIDGRLKPYVEADCHLAPQAPCAAFADD